MAGVSPLSFNPSLRCTEDSQCIVTTLNLLTWQVYGRNRGSASAKGRWLARGVETLLFQYPGLRVAFLDEASGGRQYSVFIRGTGAPPEGLDGQTNEIYRCCSRPGLGFRVRDRLRTGEGDD